MEEFEFVYHLPNGMEISAPEMETLCTYIWVNDTPYRIVEIPNENTMVLEEIEYENSY